MQKKDEDKNKINKDIKIEDISYEVKDDNKYEWFYFVSFKNKMIEDAIEFFSKNNHNQ